MSVLSNVKITSEDGLRHKFIVDGKEISHVSGAAISVAADSMPEVRLVLDSTADIDEAMIVEYAFEPESIRECMKFLSLEIQLNEIFKQAWLMSIKSALDETDNLPFMDNLERSRKILDRIIE